jgi:Tc5 transposase DNA-binding domain
MSHHVLPFKGQIMLIVYFLRFMVGRAQSQCKQQRDHSKLKDKWMDKAIEWYQADRSNSEHSTKKPRTLRDCCREAEDQCYQETKKTIKLSKSTLLRRIDGGRSIREFNAEKQWLSGAEEKIVSDYGVELAIRGFPFNHRRLKEHVDKIAHAHYGAEGTRTGTKQNFPGEGVGKNWTSRFIERHPELKAYWSHGLDHSRARAVNPTTKAAFFMIFEQTVEGDGGDDVIPPGLMWGVDETGFQEGIGGRERVFGPKDRSIQHQQRGGDRENITVLVVICADGTTLPPAVIFKGECFQTSWKQDNPLKAS